MAGAQAGVHPASPGSQREKGAGVEAETESFHRIMGPFAVKQHIK